MTINQIEYFCAVCKWGSITEAASRLYVSQPAVSMAIRELEREFGFSLFFRKNKMLELTREGAAFLEQCTSFLENYRRLCAAGHVMGNSRGSLRIGMGAMACASFFIDFSTAFQREYPDANFELMEGSVGMVCDLLDKNDLDLVFVPLSPRISDHYAFLPVQTHSVYFCIQEEKDPFAPGQELRPTDIFFFPLVLFPQEHSISRTIEKWFREDNQTADIRYRTNQLYTMIKYIKNGMAAGFLQSPVALREPGIACHKLFGMPENTLVAAWKSRQHLPSGLDRLLSFIHTCNEATQS